MEKIILNRPSNKDARYRKQCNHIFGHYEGFGTPGNYDYEPGLLVTDEGMKYLMDTPFTLCPLCGERF